MAYIDLVGLTSNSVFLSRIAYAVSSYASYIISESAAAPSHTARMNWALPAQADPQNQAVGLVWDVIQQGTVKASLGAVIDSDLQAAVEASANAHINATAGYSQYAAAAINAGFLSRVAIAVVKYSAYILGESATVPNHLARFSWASQAILNSRGIASQLAMAVVMDGNVQGALLYSSDAQIQSAVEAQINTLLIA